MNIFKAEVAERRQVGKRPIVVAVVDSMPVATSPVIERDVAGTHWTSAKYGPLIEFSAKRNDGTDPLEDALSPSAFYNAAFSDGLAPVVDVRVRVHTIGTRPSGDYILEGHWAMQLKRARSALKKHEAPWRLLMCDAEGQHGRIAWVPIENRQTCAANFLLEEECQAVGTTHVTYRNIDYWFCEHHLKAHNARHYAARQR